MPWIGQHHQMRGSWRPSGDPSAPPALRRGVKTQATTLWDQFIPADTEFTRLPIDSVASHQQPITTENLTEHIVFTIKHLLGERVVVARDAA